MLFRPNRATLRRGLAAGVATLALASFTACGGEDSDSASETSESTSDSAASDLKAGDEVPADEIKTIVGDSVEAIDTAEVTTEAEMSVQGTSNSMTGSGVMQTDPMMTQQTMTLAGQEMEVRLVDDVIYMKLPEASGMGGWMKLEIKDLSTLGLGENVEGMFDPTAMMDTYVKAVDTATYEGAEDVDGAESDHYTLTIKGKELAAQLGAAGEQAAAQLPDTITQEIWIDGEGRMVKSTSDMGPAGTTTVTYSNFGTDVSVEAPPKEEVTDFADMMGGAMPSS